ncbi:MAG: AAA family ATPase [Gemmatimonadota bacterium]|nr:MAG: AAA family ATPase [Gemmatimonadota bacterium]
MSEKRPTNHLPGRVTELTQLETILRDIRQDQSGRGRIVFLTGVSGTGKTQLAHFFLKRVRLADPEAVTLTTACVEKHSSLRPLGLFRDLLTQLIGLGGDESPALVRREMPGWLAGASSVAGRHALSDQFLSLCRVLASRRSLVLFIDDLQWCDRTSLDLLGRLGMGLATIPVLVLVTWEPETGMNAEAIRAVRQRVRPNSLELVIRELEADSIIELAETELEGSLNDDLSAWFASAAHGSPLRARLLLSWLREKKVIRKRFFSYAARRSRLPRPNLDLESVVAGRLDTLEPGLRWTLEAAALSGVAIDSALLAWQLGRGEEEILGHLQAADSQHALIVRLGYRQWATGTHSTLFGFLHPAIRKAIGRRVSGKRRSHLLRRAGETLEQLAGDESGEIADEIAAQYLAGGDRERAHEWSLKAADLAERLHAPHEMDGHLRFAVETADDELSRLRIQSRLAAMYAANERQEEAEALLTEVDRRAAELGDVATKARAGTLIGWLRLERGEPPGEVAVLAGNLVDQARRAGLTEELVAALDLSCDVAERLGRAEEALLMSEEALHVAEQSRRPELISQAAYFLARVHVSWGSPEEGRALAQRAIEVFDQVNDSAGVAVCHDLLGLASFRAGEWDDALRHWESALETTEVAGMPDQKIAMQANIADLLTLRGEFARARQLYQSGLQLAEELDDQSLALRCRVGMARLEFERGHYAAVLELTEGVRKLLPDSGAWREDFQTSAIRALAYLELGDELQAWQEATRLEQLYQGKEGWFERRAEGDAVRIRVIDLDEDAWLAGMVAKQGIGETAEKDLYGEGFLQYHQAHVLARARPSDARTAAERAVELFAKLGADPMLGRASKLLSELPAGASDDSEPVKGKLGEEKAADELDKWFDSLGG